MFRVTLFTGYCRESQALAVATFSPVQRLVTQLMYNKIRFLLPPKRVLYVLLLLLFVHSAKSIKLSTVNIYPKLSLGTAAMVVFFWHYFLIWCSLLILIMLLFVCVCVRSCGNCHLAQIHDGDDNNDYGAVVMILEGWC